MAKINDKLNRIQLQAEALQDQIIETVNDLGIYTNHFVSVHNLVLITIDTIRNIPIDKRGKFEQARYEKDKWLQSVKDIQMRFEKTNSQIAKQGE